MYSSLLSDMNQDYRDMRISPENLQNLASSIRILSREVHGMAKIVEKSHPAEQKWLLSMIDEFAQNIRLWIDRHATELSIEGWNIANSSIGEVPSVTLAKKRLDMQIEQFERAKILI